MKVTVLAQASCCFLRDALMEVVPWNGEISKSLENQHRACGVFPDGLGSLPFACPGHFFAKVYVIRGLVLRR